MTDEEFKTLVNLLRKAELSLRREAYQIRKDYKKSPVAQQDEDKANIIMQATGVIYNEFGYLQKEALN